MPVGAQTAVDPARSQAAVAASDLCLIEVRGRDGDRAKELINGAIGSAAVEDPLFRELPFVGARGLSAEMVARVRSLAAVADVHPLKAGSLRVVCGYERALALAREVEGVMNLGRDGRLTRDGRLIAINISLGTDDVPPYDPHDPVNVASRSAARRIPVVAAAGNAGYISDGRETMSAWAQAPWVISVAATTSDAGGTVAPYSSVGDKRVRRTHPTLAAYGASALDATKQGTSFAAPRVTRQLLVLATFCETIRAAATTMLAGIPQGTARPFVLFIDCQIGRVYDGRETVPDLPQGGLDLDVLRRILDELKGAGLSLDLEPTPPRLKKMLVAATQRLQGCSRRLVGAGFISDDTTLGYMSAFTGAELARVFTPAALSRNVPLAARLAKLRLAISEELAELVPWWRLSHVQIPWDIGMCNGEALSAQRLDIVARS